MSRALLLFSVSCLVAMLTSCAGGTTARTKPAKPPTYKGRVLTGVTEYYRPGYTAPRISVPAQPEKPRANWFAKRSSGGSSVSIGVSGGGANATTPKAKPVSSSQGSPYQGGVGKFLSKISWGATVPSGGFPASSPPVFANPDGTTSRVEGFYLVRSDGTRGDMIGNTIFHPDGSKSRIEGNILIHPDGSKSRRIR